MMLRRTPIYPFLFAAYPVLALTAHNIHEVALSEIWRSVLLSLLLAGILLGLLRLFIHDWHRAALMATVVLVLMFSYGQVYAEMRGIRIEGIPLFRHRTLGALWGGLMILGVIWVWRWLKSAANWTPWLNLVGMLLLVYPLSVVALDAAGRAAQAIRRSPSHPLSAGAQASRPDVYYIILDGYGRHDLLQEKFGYDNSEFTNGLKQRGFYVAECAQSNYAFTLYSLASSLNYDYVEHLGSESPTEDSLDPFIQHAAIRTFFENQGYRTVAFPTGFPWTEWKDADIYFGDVASANKWNDFEILLAQTTLFRIPLDLTQLKYAVNMENNRRARILSAIDNLKEVPREDGNLFVFAHIVAPHRPYVFGPDGEQVSIAPDAPLDVQRAAYADQARFISGEILRVIDAIQTASDVPPVIIIQGDHGPSFGLVTHQERMRNLNAYFLPGIDGSKVLYPTITPVNTFRVILNSYFGQSLPLLDDWSYFSTYQRRAHPEEIPNTCTPQP